jgi:hypothetical protein
MRIVRAADRYRTEQPGIESWHCFSAGPHYDPGNIAFHALVGVDEHLLAAGAGFDWHAHRGVVIVTCVLDGALRHADSRGMERLVQVGELFTQQTGDGIRHTQTNASETEPLRFVQTTVLGDDGDVRVVRETFATAAPAHLFVARGAWQAGDQTLAEGDSVRAEAPIVVAGRGELIVCEMTLPDR